MSFHLLVRSSARALYDADSPSGLRVLHPFRLIGFALLLLSLALPPDPVQADDTWETPFDVSVPMSLADYEPGDPIIQTFGAEMVSLSDGASLVAWIRYVQVFDDVLGEVLRTQIQMRRIDADGTLGPITDLTGIESTALPSRVLGMAVDHQDNVILAWYAAETGGTSIWPTISATGERGPREISRGGYTPHALWIHADGTVGDVLTLSEPLAVIDDIDVVVDHSGRATVGWLYGSALLEPDNSNPDAPTFVSAHRRITARPVLPSQALGSPVEITAIQDPFVGENFDISMVADSTGAVLISWAWDPTLEYRVSYAGIGRLQAMAVVESDGTLRREYLNERNADDELHTEEISSGAKLVAHPDDTVTAIWPSAGRRGGDANPGQSRLAFRQIHRIGTERVLGVYGYLEEPDVDKALGRRRKEWDITMGPDGRALAAWRLQTDSTEVWVRARALASNGVAGAKHTVGGPAVDIVDTEALVGPDGIATILWSAQGGAILADTTYALNARRLLSDATFGPTVALTDLPSEDLRLVVDRVGNVTAVWATQPFAQGPIHTSGSRLLPRNTGLDGVCGAAAGQPSLLFPDAGLCLGGPAFDQASANGIHSWVCPGVGTGSDAQCNAPGLDTGGSSGSGTMTLFADSLNGTDACQVTDATRGPAPDGLPPGVHLPHGVLEFTVEQCPGGATITMTYSSPVEGYSLWKYLDGNWATIPAPDAILTGNTVHLTLLDNGPWDADGTVGVIRDPSGPGVVSGPAVPTLHPLMLGALGLMLGLIGVFGPQRRRGIGSR